MQIAVIIPAYNEVKRIVPVLERIPRQVAGYPVLTIVVDDGSRDKTSEVARKVAGVRVIRHRTNLGKGGAAKTGCDAAYRLGADIMVLMDADGQHRPEDIERMLTPLLVNGEASLVVGTRRRGKEMPVAMRLGNLALFLFSRFLFDIRVQDTQSGFRAFTRGLYPSIRWASSNYAMETEMLILAAKQRVNFVEVGIDTIYLDNYKGTTPLDGVRILAILLKWRLLWLRESSSLEPFSAWS